MLWRLTLALVSTTIYATLNNSLIEALAVELIVEKASGIESATYDHFGGTTAGYKAKIRSLFVNLKDKNNPGLRESIVSGEIPFDKLPTMTSEVRHFPPFLNVSLMIARTWRRKSDKQQTIR